MRYSVVAGCCIILACSKASGPGVRSVVFTPFEDLRGVPGEPVAEALRLALAQSIDAQASVLPITPSHVRELSEISTAFRIDGYVAPDGFHLSINSEPLTCKGSLDDCATKFAGQIATRTGASQPELPPPGAALALVKARESATAEAWRAAAEAHKDYGPVWLGRIEQAAAIGAEPALSILAGASTKAWRKADVARLEVIRAALQRDRIKLSEAFEKLAELTPADPQNLQRAAASAIESRRFRTGVVFFERILATGPNPVVSNDAAYAAAFAGDRAKAEKFVALALHGAPTDARFMDTAGDVAYFFGDYAAAARHYSAANAHLKAAEAFALAGDKQSEEAMLAKQPGDGLNKALLLWRSHQDAAAIAAFENSTNPRAAFYLALAKLHARDFAAAKALRQRVKQPSIEFVILSALIDTPPQNAGEAVLAVHAFLRGDKEKCLAQIAAAKTRLHPFADSSLRRIEASAKGEKRTGYIPSALDDWLAFIARE